MNRKIDSVDASEAIQQNNIPLKIIKENRNTFSEFIMHNFNYSISMARFPDILKTAEVKTVFQKKKKKKSKIDKESYRPVTILSVILKIF